MSDITQKQKRFIDEYLTDLNARQAAIRAGYSVKTADQQASRLLSNAKVRDKIQELILAKAQKLEVAQSRCIDEILRIAFSNITDVSQWDEEGNLTIQPSDMIDPLKIGSIAEIERRETADGRCRVKIKMHDKLRAIELLIRLYELQKNIELEERLDEIERRLSKNNAQDCTTD